jgi:hypothetical protein
VVTTGFLSAFQVLLRREQGRRLALLNSVLNDPVFCPLFLKSKSAGFLSVNLTQIILNITLAHAFCIHCHNFLLDFISPGLPLFENFRLKLTVAVTGYGYFAFAVIAYDGLAVICRVVIWFMIGLMQIV